MTMENRMEMRFPALPQNESLARVAVAAFAVQLNPTLGEMADINTAGSEAVTNAIVHGYRDATAVDNREVLLSAEFDDRRELTVAVADEGCGIANVEQAMQPFFSTGSEDERSGMGFCVMQTFMDAVRVDSAPGRGTTVTLRKRVSEAPLIVRPTPAVLPLGS